MIPHKTTPRLLLAVATLAAFFVSQTPAYAQPLGSGDNNLPLIPSSTDTTDDSTDEEFNAAFRDIGNTSTIVLQEDDEHQLSLPPEVEDESTSNSSNSLSSSSSSSSSSSASSAIRPSRNQEQFLPLPAEVEDEDTSNSSNSSSSSSSSSNHNSLSFIRASEEELPSSVAEYDDADAFAAEAQKIISVDSSQNKTGVVSRIWNGVKKLNPFSKNIKKSDESATEPNASSNSSSSSSSSASTDDALFSSTNSTEGWSEEHELDEKDADETSSSSSSAISEEETEEQLTEIPIQDKKITTRQLRKGFLATIGEWWSGKKNKEAPNGNENDYGSGIEVPP